MTVMVSETIPAVHGEHDCCGEGCPVCLLVQGAENFSRQLKYSAFHPGFSSNDLFLAAVVRNALNVTVFLLVPLSAVGLKVKMNR
jgi:hypothetical protein